MPFLAVLVLLSLPIQFHEKISSSFFHLLVCSKSICLADKSAVEGKGRQWPGSVHFVLKLFLYSFIASFLHSMCPVSLLLSNVPMILRAAPLQGCAELMGFIPYGFPLTFQLQLPLFHISKHQSSLYFQENVKISVPMMAPSPFLLPSRTEDIPSSSHCSPTTV